MHYYSFHIGDYKSHTHHLTLMEDLAFRRLLDHYYLHQAPIKQRDIARQIGMRDQEQDVLTVLNEFFVSTEDGFINPRADKEIAAYCLMAEAGKRGADKRWKKGGDSPPIATPLPPLTPPNSNHEPVTINHEPLLIPVAKATLSTAKLMACPQEEILKLWAKHLPHLAQPRSWEGTRRATTKQRWNQASRPSAYSPDGYQTEAAGIKWWDSFFNYIARNTSLANGFESEGRTWRPDLEWVLNARNFQRIIDGKYTK
jgi:uncharacterized protein YdaU (DUF1376 family)